MVIYTTWDVAQGYNIAHTYVLDKYRELGMIGKEYIRDNNPRYISYEITEADYKLLKWLCAPKRISLDNEFEYDGEVFRCVPDTQRKLACSKSGRFIGRKRTILKQRKQSNGYVWYALVDESGECRNVYAHRGVASAWIPNPEVKEYVNHIDGDKTNNCVDNLEWVTASENSLHAYRTGLAWNLPRAGECGFRKMTRASNRTIQAKLLKEQGGLCPICCKPIVYDSKDKASAAVTDHVHDETGAVRAVLHRGCNGFLGKAEGTTRWAGASLSDNDTIAELLINAGFYLLRDTTAIQYYLHKSDEEKRLAANAKARKQRAVKRAAQEIKK